MPGKARNFSSDKDDLIWEKLEEDSDAWCKSIRHMETYHKVIKFMRQYKDSQPEELHRVIQGDFNIVFRLEFKDRTSLVMRVPIKGIITWLN